MYTTTVGNLIDILTDTISNAALASPVDHLASVTKVSPLYEFVGATVDAFLQVPFNVDYHDANTDVVYTKQIDVDSRYRYRDAANLIVQTLALLSIKHRLIYFRDILILHQKCLEMVMVVEMEHYVVRLTFY